MSTSSVRHDLTRLTIVFVLSVVSHVITTAQVVYDPINQPHLWYRLQDSSAIYLLANGGRDTIDPNLISYGYSFDMVYDSSAITTYSITEFKRNGHQLRMQKWENDRQVNAPAALLSFNTTTDTFTCHTGDTLSFYRDLTWRNFSAAVMDTGNYYALDSLDYAVELIRTSDSTRIALLDSIGILANPVPASPRIHGMRPLMAVAQYVIPGSMNNTRAFMRLRLYHRGSGPYFFTRLDHVTVSMSNRLNDSDWMDFISVFTPTVPKNVIRDIGESGESTGLNKAGLDVRQAADEVSIAFDTRAGEPAAIGIYDALGSSVFFPYMTAAATGSRTTTTYRCTQSGLYIVALFHNGELVGSRKILFTK